MRLIHKGLVLVGVPLVLAVVVIACMFGSMLRLDQDRLQEAKQRRYADVSAEGVLCITELADALGNLLKDDDRRELSRMKALALRLRDLRTQAESMTASYDNDQSAKEIRQFSDEIVGKLQTFVGHGSILNKLMAASDLDASTLNTQMFNVAQHAHTQNLSQLKKLQDGRDREQATFRQQTALLIGAAGASILVAFGLAFWFMKGIALRLQIMMDNTMRMAAGQMLNPPLYGHDEIAKVDGAFHNMSRALRETMAKEHALFESASDVIMIADDQYRLTSANPACLPVLGYDTRDLEGKAFLELVVADDQDKTRSALNASRQAGEQKSFESRCQHVNGKVIDLLWSVYWSDLDGALYMVAHDISERKQLERLKEAFLSMVSHDLRSPLTSISGTFKLIAAGAFGGLPAALEGRLSAIVSNVDRLLSLVNDLLDMEKLESGKMELAKQTVSVTELLSKAASEVESLAGQKHLTVEIDCSAGQFAFDGDRMLQVLINLLSNAVKFSPEHATINLSAAESDGGLIMEVIDHGRGIPESHRLLIFERFQQVESADGKRNQGTGLGLPICKKIVEEHGGTINALSTPGQGTTFRVVLPYSTAVPSELLPTSPTKSGQATAAATAEGASRHHPQSAAVLTAGSTSKGTFHLPSFADLKLIHKGIILVVVPVAFELVFACCLYPLLYTSFQEKQFETQQWLIALDATDLFMNGLAFEFSRHMSGGTELQLSNFRQKAADAMTSLHDLLQLTEQDPQIATDGRQVGQYWTQLYRGVSTSRLVAVKGREPVAYFGISSDDLFEKFRVVRPLIQHLIDYAESKGNRSPAKLELLHKQQAAVLLSALIASWIICVLSAMLFANGLVKRLQVMEDNIGKFEHDEPLHPPLEGTDELAGLDRVFHSMVAALTEARYKERAVFDNAQDVMAVIDIDGKILRVNPACERQWNLRPDDVVGHSIFDLIDHSGEKPAITAFRAVSSGAPAEDVETIITGKGTTSETLLSLSWSQTEKNVVAIAHDISHRKELERLKQEFLAMVSHDMRTPLSAIMSNAEMMIAGVFGALPEKAAAHLNAAVRNCERLLNLINDLLDIEKLEAGQMHMTRQPISARDVLQRSAESLLTMCEQKRIHVDVQAHDDLVVFADADRLVQVVVNLLANAIKFSPENSVIELTAVRAGDSIEFRVQDHGRGIPGSHMSAVFERFRQVQAADGNRHGGTGLGLPICKQIVELHGGTIAVSSHEGAGSTFYFRIPAATAEVP